VRQEAPLAASLDVDAWLARMGKAAIEAL